MNLPEVFDNKNKILRDDIAAQLKAGSKLSIAAACFYIYAYQELKEELQRIKKNQNLILTMLLLS